MTDGEDEDSDDGWSETKARMKEGDRLKSLARMEKRVRKKKKAEIRKKEMKAKNREDNGVDERGTREGDGKKNNPTGSNESKTTRHKGWVPVSSIPHGGRNNSYGRRVETTNAAHESTDREDDDSAHLHLSSVDRYLTSRDYTPAGAHGRRVPCVTLTPRGKKIKTNSLSMITTTYLRGWGNFAKKK